MKPVFVIRVAALVAIAGFAFACTDRSDFVGPPVATNAPPANSLGDLLVTCSADVQTRTVKCGDPNNGFKSNIIYGGQGTYVKLTSSNTFVVADTIGFDVDVQNLLGQAIGTSDSSHTPDPGGVRVFFVQNPTSTGAGTISVANADGLSVFTGANQAFFRYASVPLPGESTGTRTWKLQFSPQVTNFTFQVGISTAVEFPHGYIDGTARVLTLSPSESYTLSARVRSTLGVQQNNQPVTWSSSNPSVAPVVDSTVTGGSLGYSVLTAVSGARPTADDVYVHTCPYISVANGTVHADAVANTDCFSAFNANEGFLPGTSYYGDLYRVTLNAGQTIDISVDTDNTLDSMVALMDRLGFHMADNDDDEIGSLGLGSRLQFTATRSGTYVIQVTTVNPGDTGTYTLSISITDPI